MSPVRYFSYGAAVQPSIWSVFRLSHRILAEVEGPNDGLVSVASSRWGGDRGYKGTLVGVSHLDLINWTNRLKWVAGELMGNPRKFNAIAFYLDIAGMASQLTWAADANKFDIQICWPRKVFEAAILIPIIIIEESFIPVTLCEHRQIQLS